jgi:hypothetical protein
MKRKSNIKVGNYLLRLFFFNDDFFTHLFFKLFGSKTCWLSRRFTGIVWSVRGKVKEGRVLFRKWFVKAL